MPRALFPVHEGLTTTVTIKEIAYREASRSISQQQSTLDNVRSRVGVLFSAASVATAFLGGEALRDQRLDGVSWVAVILYVGVLVVTLAILWPYTFEFRFNAKMLLGNDWAGRDEEDAYGHLAGFLEDQYQNNESKIERMLGGLQLAALFLAIEVVCWLGVLGTR